MSCPLCQSSNTAAYARDKRREFLQCQHCYLIFVPSEQLLTLSAEKAIYDYHENNPEDEGYRQFLRRLTDPLKQLIAASFSQQSALQLLDYGCGPGPALPSLMAPSNVQCHCYDPLYAGDTELLQRTYDIVTATEVVEHFHHPKEDFDRLFGQLLKPDGLLAIMTKPAVAAEHFANWHYKNDLTHVSFYSDTTFAHIAKHYQTHYRRISPTVTFFARWL